MKVGFDQIRVRESQGEGLAYSADTIIKAHDLRQLTATIHGASVENDEYLAEQCSIVGDFGKCLNIGFIRGTDVCDAKILPHSKNEIQRALKACAAQLPLKEDEISLLGDMHFYLSYFVEGWEPSVEGNEHELFVKQAAEGDSLRSEWQTAFPPKRLSKFSRMISAWLKPNA